MTATIEVVPLSGIVARSRWDEFSSGSLQSRPVSARTTERLACSIEKELRESALNDWRRR